MTVNTTNITSGPYAGNDVADTFDYTFRVEDKTQLSVYETNSLGVKTTLTVDVDYTVAGIGVDGGGTITRTAGALPTGYTWYIRSNYIENQLTDFASQGGFFPQVHEKQMDHLTFLVQQTYDFANRACGLSESVDVDGNFKIEDDAIARAGKYLRFDASGDLQISTEPQIITADVIFDTVALMKLASPTAGLIVSTRGYYSVGDGGGATYLIVAPQAFDGYGDHELANGNVAVLQHSGRINVRQFGAKADIVTPTDDSASFEAALVAGDIFVPNGDYHLADEVVIPLRHSVIGESRRQTKIKVDSSFNMAANGVFRFAAGEPGGEISGITINFYDQPDSVTIGDYVNYPPAIYAVGVPRFKITNMRIAEAWDGIDMTANSGAAVIEDLELSMFNVGIDIDGSLDSIKISKLHLWPFGIDDIPYTANQRTIFADSYGIKSGKNDDFHFSDSLIFSIRKGLYLYNSASGYTFGAITNVDFDDRGGIVIVDDARVSFNSCWFTQGKADAQLFSMSGGNVECSSCHFVINIAQTGGYNGFIEQTGGILRLTGNNYQGSSIDQQFIYSSSSILQVNGGTITRAVNIAYTAQFIRLINTKGNVVGVYGNNLGTGGSKLIKVDTDSGVTVSNINAITWSIDTPTASLNNVITDNKVSSGGETYRPTGYFSADGTTTVVVPSGWSVARLSAGNYTITHNQGLAAIKDMLIFLTSDTPDTTVTWDVVNSTTNQFRIRSQTAGVATDADINFVIDRRH